jgi:hypothetical protein
VDGKRGEEGRERTLVFFRLGPLIVLRSYKIPSQTILTIPELCSAALVVPIPPPRSFLLFISRCVLIRIGGCPSVLVVRRGSCNRALSGRRRWFEGGVGRVVLIVGSERGRNLVNRARTTAAGGARRGGGC